MGVNRSRRPDVHPNSDTYRYSNTYAHTGRAAYGNAYTVSIADSNYGAAATDGHAYAKAAFAVRGSCKRPG